MPYKKKQGWIKIYKIVKKLSKDECLAITQKGAAVLKFLSNVTMQKAIDSCDEKKALTFLVKQQLDGGFIVIKYADRLDHARKAQNTKRVLAVGEYVHIINEHIQDNKNGKAKGKARNNGLALNAGQINKGVGEYMTAENIKRSRRNARQREMYRAKKEKMEY